MNSRITSKNINKLRDLVLAFVIAIFIPYFSFNVTNRLIYDPGFGYKWNYLHHFIQMIIALLIMILPIWGKKSLSDWGYNFNDWKWSLKIVGVFCIGYLGFNLLGTYISQSLSGWPVLRSYVSTAELLKNLSFSVTMPGLSEETIFRALTMGILMRSWKGYLHFGKIEIPTAGVIAAILFALAHVGFSLRPFQIIYYHPMQLAFAFGLGIFYAVIYDRTKSLLGPILAHNASDGIVEIILIVLSPR